MEEYQSSLFEVAELISNTSKPKLDVIKVEFIGAETMDWNELFDGFDELSAITYSSGIGFVYELSKKFKKMEVIFGCEDVISYQFNEILAYQGKLMDRLRDSSSKLKVNIAERLDDGSIHLYVANSQLSHEKIYLLKAEDGRKRVITGSANMSFNAFGGRQRENISYFEGDRAYDWYKDIFDSLKSSSTDEITKKAFMQANAEENLEDLPISETVRSKRTFVIEQASIEEKDNIKFFLDVKNLAKELDPLMPAKDKKRRTIIQTEHITKIRRKILDGKAQLAELRSEYPQLDIDAMDCVATLNGQKLDLNPTKEKIKKDVDLFIKYMDGYKSFHGDYIGMQLRYYEFANWFFCSPFMATMRDMASRYDQKKLPYPVFGLLYGKSKAGKTSFLETLLKMMIGQKPKLQAVDFTRSNIDGLKNKVHGVPIIVDDLTNTRFNQHAIETIKNDDFGVETHNVHYPAVVISANEDVKAVAPEVIRRTIICRGEAGLTNTEVMKSRIVRQVQHNIGTAFYREYLRRMMERIPSMVLLMSDDETENAPDILKESSKVLLEIISENTEEIPLYVRTLSLENYFAEQVTGKHCIETIKNAWRINSKAFQVNEKINELRYNAGSTIDADRLIKELPENLEARKARETIIMVLDVAREFFEEDFRLAWYKHIFRS